MYNARFVLFFACLLLQSLCLICELFIKVHKISVFKEYTLGCPFSKFQPEPPVPPPPHPNAFGLRNSNRKYSPMPWDFQFKDPPPPLPSEFQKAIRVMVWFFSGIAHCKQSWGVIDLFFYKVSIAFNRYLLITDHLLSFKSVVKGTRTRS